MTRANVENFSQKNWQGVKAMGKKLTDFVTLGESISLKYLDNTTFTVIGAERSEYDGNDGVVLKMKDQHSCIIDGKTVMYDTFHTTRQVITQFFLKESVQESLNNGDEIGPLKMEQRMSKNKRNVWCLVDA